MTSTHQLSQTVRIPWASAEPLFGFWLDIVYNEPWLVNLFKWLLLFRSPLLSLLSVPSPSPPRSPILPRGWHLSAGVSARGGAASPQSPSSSLFYLTRNSAANQYISWALQACPVPFCSNAPQMWRGGVGALESPRCQGLLKPPTTTGLQPVILSTGEVNKAAWASSAWITDSEWCLFVSADPVLRLHPGKPRQLATEWAEIGFSS